MQVYAESLELVKEKNIKLASQVYSTAGYGFYADDECFIPACVALLDTEPVIP